MVVPNRKVRSHVLLTRLPLAPKCPFDLHVLSLPPAFALSQDQTLRFIHHHQAPKDPTATPNHPALTLSPTIIPAIPNNQTPSLITQGTSPSQSQHPGADRASHPSPPAALHRATSTKRQSPQPSLSPAPSHPSLRTAKNQTLPKPMQLSKNNTRSTRQ